MEQFQCNIDRDGNLWVASGWVYKSTYQQLRESGADPNLGLASIAGQGMPMFDGMSATGPAAATFIGGSGRLLIATPSVTLGNPDAVEAILGFYTPDWSDAFRSVMNNAATLVFTSTTAAEISDGTNVVAAWASGADAPLGVYAATTYGRDTYNDGTAFNITITEELTGGRVPAAADLQILAGTAVGGGYFPSGAQTFANDNSNWTIVIDSDGVAELKYLTNVVATRIETDRWDDPSGTYESTTYGATNYNGGVAWTARCTRRNAWPRTGYAILQLNMSGTSLESVSKPFFATSIPTNTATEIYFPLFVSNGSTIAQQLHQGMLVWSDAINLGAVSVQQLTLSDTVWDDIRINSGGFEISGTSDPSQVDWQPGGSGPNLRLWEFAKDDQIFCSAQMPHGYKAGTNLQLHVHWTPGKYGVAQRGNKVGWKIDITAAHYGSVFPACTTVDLQHAVAADCANDQHLITPSTTFTVPSGFAESSMLIMRVYRSDTGTDDTWSETLSGRLPMLLEIDIHHQIDKIGSNNEIPD